MAWVLGAVVVVTMAFGLVWRKRNGRVRMADTTDVVTAEDLQAPLGGRATLVQFSTAFCQPCRATRRILTEVTEMVPDVAHVEIDAESRLDLVRRLGINRTPTVLVLDAEGHIRRRASGAPRKADVIAALGEVLLR
jgi:thiol-disulfide isomerase/thioredoxin